MRVLDLDLDFFLSDCCDLAELGGRPSAIGCEPWKERAVRRFLEINCGLDVKKRIPGRVFDTHDGAIFFWHEQIESGKLTQPFDVVHVDAHADLGIGAPGPQFVLDVVLSRTVAARPNLEQYRNSRKLDEANYLLFTLAFRWIRRLINIRNPRSRPDIPAQICVLDSKGEKVGILLRSQISAMMEKQNGVEPMVDFEVYDDYTQYREKTPYDFVTLAHSPRYSPVEADGLIKIIRDYIEII